MEFLETQHMELLWSIEELKSQYDALVEEMSQKGNEFAEVHHESYYERADQHIERIDKVIMDEL